MKLPFEIKFLNSESSPHMLNEVKEYGTRGKGHRFQENIILKNIKAFHLLFATAWGGGALGLQALSFLKISSTDPTLIATITECMRWVDLCVVMPGLFGCMLTGLFYSIFTSMGFFKFFWIGYKWIISFTAGFWGLLFLSPLGNLIIEKLAPYGLDWPLIIARSFIIPENAWQGLIQILVILSMCLISVYRPLSLRIIRNKKVEKPN